MHGLVNNLGIIKSSHFQHFYSLVMYTSVVLNDVLLHTTYWKPSNPTTCSLSPRRLCPSGVCSWTSCSLALSSDRWVPRGPSSPSATDTGCASTTASAPSSTSPWSSTTSPRRPRSSVEAETCVERGTSRQLRGDDRAPSPPPRSAPEGQ